GAPVAGLVRDEPGVLGPVEEEEGPEAGPLDPAQELLGDDLVGVDVGPVERGDDALDRHEPPHAGVSWNSRTSTRWPAIAAAAAIGGLTRWVRPPLPRQPYKFPFLVEAQRPPGPRLSGFMPKHIEQAAARHPKPALPKTDCRPSLSASLTT